MKAEPNASGAATSGTMAKDRQEKACRKWALTWSAFGTRADSGVHMGRWGALQDVVEGVEADEAVGCNKDDMVKDARTHARLAQPAFLG